MRKFYIFLAAVLTIALQSTVARADRLAWVNPVAVWKGSYAGVHLSWGQGKLQLNGATAVAAAAAGTGTTMSRPDGASLALRGGYDWQHGQMVIGLTGEAELGQYKAGLEPNFTALSSDSFELRMKNAITMGVRLGYAAENWLLYGMLGYTVVRAELTALGTSGTASLRGVSWGIGGEYQTSSPWSIFAEYSHSDFGTLKGSNGVLKSSLGQMKLGLNYRF